MTKNECFFLFLNVFDEILQLGRIAALRTPQESLLSGLQQRYAAEALIADGGSLEVLVRRASECLEEAVELRSGAQQKHGFGNLLAAAQMHQAAEQNHQRAEALWQEVSHHAERLAALHAPVLDHRAVDRNPVLHAAERGRWVSPRLTFRSCQQCLR